MKVKRYLLLSFILLITTIYFVVENSKTEKTITYFPIHDEQAFTTAVSKLNPLQDSFNIEWVSTSESEEKQYLRQDVSLLFTNGALTGVLNKWKRNTAQIEQKKDVIIKPAAVVETVSFHHGEIHHHDSITSIQHMSQDELFILDNRSFKESETTTEKKQVDNLMHYTNKRLQKHWNNLIAYFNVNINDYSEIPFNKLIQFEQDLTKDFTKEISEQIIGQLWEGLYKNYILQAVEANSNDLMPLILFANDHTHLLVIYKIKNEKHQLIQRVNVVD